MTVLETRVNTSVELILRPMPIFIKQLGHTPILNDHDVTPFASLLKVFRVDLVTYSPPV